MNDDPRTAGGVPPRETVTLVRTPLSVPVKPHVQNADEGRPALSSPSELARGGDQAHRFENPAPAFGPNAADEPVIDDSGFAAVLDATGMPDEVLADMRTWMEAGGKQEHRQHDQADENEITLALNALWGDKAPSEIENLRKFLAALPEDELAAFTHARDSAGRLLQHDSEVVVRLAGLARSRASAASGLNTIEGIEQYMRSHPSKYRSDEAVQARYRELIDQRERRKG